MRTAKNTVTKNAAPVAALCPGAPKDAARTIGGKPLGRAGPFVHSGREAACLWRLCPRGDRECHAMALPRPFALLPVALLWVSCKGNGGTQMDLRHNHAGGGTQIATFGDDSITAEELKARFAEMSPYARARYQTVEQK